MKKLLVTLLEVDRFSREKKDYIDVVIEADEDFDSATVEEYLVNNLEDFRQIAAKQVAGSRVDYDSYDSDSEYLDRLERIADGLYLFDVAVHGAQTRMYTVEGSYPDDHGLFTENMVGCCIGEACFNARRTMAFHAGYDVETYALNEDSATDAAESLMLEIEDQKIEGYDLVRPTPREAADMIFEWMTMAGSDQTVKLKLDLMERGMAFIEAVNADDSDEIILLEQSTALVPA